jgi:transcriptional regulator with XRE-family HTH domain
MRMLRHLAQAAKDARVKAGVHQVEVAAQLRVRESTIARFEKGEAWPSNADATIEAYAEVIETVSARDLWAEALKLWRASAALAETERATTEMLARSDPKRQRGRASKRRSAGSSD